LLYIPHGSDKTPQRQVKVMTLNIGKMGMQKEELVQNVARKMYIAT